MIECLIALSQTLDDYMSTQLPPGVCYRTERINTQSTSSALSDLAKLFLGHFNQTATTRNLHYIAVAMGATLASQADEHYI